MTAQSHVPGHGGCFAPASGKHDVDSLAAFERVVAEDKTARRMARIDGADSGRATMTTGQFLTMLRARFKLISQRWVST